MWEDVKVAFKKTRVWLAGVYASWTMRVNAAVATLALYWDQVTASLPEIKTYLSDAYAKWVLLAYAVVNIFLRFKTAKPLSERAPEK